MNTCGFSKKIIPVLKCQIDGSSLSLASTSREDGEVLHEATLVCGGQEKHLYSISGGILDFMAHQPQLGSVQASEVVARDVQAESYDSRLSARYFKEIISTKKLCGPVTGKNVIEYGCGTGRMTAELLDAYLIVACDFSKRSLQVLAAKLPLQKNVGLILADATQLKTAADFFDVSLSTQVIEHIPTAKERNMFFRNNLDTLKSGAGSISSVYHFDTRRSIRGRPKEGSHSSGIFYHYFSRTELVKEISKVFKVTDSKIIDITLPGESRLKLSSTVGGKLSRCMEHIPFLRNFGHLVLVRAVVQK